MNFITKLKSGWFLERPRDLIQSTYTYKNAHIDLYIYTQMNFKKIRVVAWKAHYVGVSMSTNQYTYICIHRHMYLCKYEFQKQIRVAPQKLRDIGLSMSTNLYIHLCKHKCMDMCKYRCEKINQGGSSKAP